jgi:general secretion pathway protein C
MDIRLTERHIVALNFLLIAVLAYFAALSVNDIVAMRLTPASAPVPRQVERPVDNGVANRSRGAYQEIVNRDIFNIAPPPQPHVQVVEKIDLHLDLIGISTATAGKSPYAIIADRLGQQNVYRLGEMVLAAGKLVEVDKDRVFIDHNGKRIELELPKNELPGPVQSVQPIPPPVEDDTSEAANDDSDDEAYDPNVEDLGDNRYKIPRATLDHSVGNMTQLLTQIRAIPNIQNGKTNGFALSEIEPGSVFDEMGLQEGDVLRSVNGQQMTDPTQAMQMMNALRSASQITIQVLREGHPTTLTYQIQ